jgi:hypothetical protein
MAKATDSAFVRSNEKAASAALGGLVLPDELKPAAEHRKDLWRKSSEKILQVSLRPPIFNLRDSKDLWLRKLRCDRKGRSQGPTRPR